MKEKIRKVWACPKNGKHGVDEGSGFQIMTYDEPPKCSFCGEQLKQVEQDEKI